MEDICSLFLMSFVYCTDEQILSSSLPASSVAVPAAAPPVCQPKSATNGHHPVPRLSISSRATVVARMEGASQGGLQTVMKWKTVVAIFVVVVVYLVTGGLVFRALEQPFESSQKNTIALEKAEFLRDHICVSPQELETLIQVSWECVSNIQQPLVLDNGLDMAFVGHQVLSLVIREISAEVTCVILQRNQQVRVEGP